MADKVGLLTQDADSGRGCAWGTPWRICVLLRDRGGYEAAAVCWIARRVPRRAQRPLGLEDIDQAARTFTLMRRRRGVAAPIGAELVEEIEEIALDGIVVVAPRERGERLDGAPCDGLAVVDGGVAERLVQVALAGAGGVRPI